MNFRFWDCCPNLLSLGGDVVQTGVAYTRECANNHRRPGPRRSSVNPTFVVPGVLTALLTAAALLEDDSDDPVIILE